MKCAVITPYGPRHEQLVEDCKASVDKAMARSMGPFSEVVHIVVDDSAGAIGRSNARNQAIREAQSQGADWLFLVDADDLVMADVFESIKPWVDQHDALWGQICTGKFGESDYSLREPQVRQINSLIEVMSLEPSQTLQMGHFVRTAVAMATPFDPDRDFGEDFDYYLRLWRQYRCVKIPKPLFLNRIGQSARGPRAGDGHQWRPHVHEVIRQFARQIDLKGYAEYQGERAEFAVYMPYDMIQQHYLFGKYYREPELDFLKTRVPPGADIVEVGAGVGNDLVFMSKHLHPNSLVAFEPNPIAAELLHINMKLNNIHSVDCSRLATAIGESAGRARVHTPDVRNVGHSYLLPDTKGDITLLPLDDVVTAKVDLLKIDAPGAALHVLAGASRTVATYRPSMMIEVDDNLLADFRQWLETSDYVIQREFTGGSYPRQAASRAVFIAPRPGEEPIT